MSLTPERLKELVCYHPETGEFTWAKTRRRCRLGDKAGCRMRNGYIIIRIDDTLHLAHRLAWLYMTGSWPPEQIDHINRNRADNRWENLRAVSNMENAWNKTAPRNRSGFTGVRRENNKWLAEIKVNYKPIRLGLYETPEAAHAAYLEAKRKLHQKFPA
jgi:hypothetical protein